MGHRAIVAYERPRRRSPGRIDTGTSDGDGRLPEYTVRYSHWGAHDYRILEAVSARTPFGRNPNTAEGMENRTGPGPGSPTSTTPLVDRKPLGTATGLGDLARGFVDPVTYEAVFVVSTTYEIDVLHPLAFDGSGETPSMAGALVDLARDRDTRQVAREIAAWNDGWTATNTRSGPGPSEGTGDGNGTGTGDASGTGNGTGAGEYGSADDDGAFARWLDALRSLPASRAVYPNARTTGNSIRWSDGTMGHSDRRERDGAPAFVNP
jgi:hypothetical protein